MKTVTLFFLLVLVLLTLVPSENPLEYIFEQVQTFIVSAKEVPSNTVHTMYVTKEHIQVSGRHGLSNIKDRFASPTPESSEDSKDDQTSALVVAQSSVASDP